VPVIGVASDSTSWAPVAMIGARGGPADIGILQDLRYRIVALPSKLYGELRSATSRIALSAIETGTMMLELRETGGSGGISASTGALLVARGHSQSMAFRLIANETATTATPIKIVLRCIGRRIVPPDH